MSRMELTVPDLGGGDAIPVIEILVQQGERVEKEQSLITLESEKATIEVPASAAGVVVELRVQLGDLLSTGDVIGVLALAESEPAAAPSPVAERAAPHAATVSHPTDGANHAQVAAATVEAAATTTVEVEAKPEAKPAAEFDCDVVVLGAGPGGYTAAFRAADLGLRVILVERDANLGGVCLNVGCIPSKALLHTAKVIDEAAAMAKHGVSFGTPQIDLDTLRGWKNQVVTRLTKGLEGLAKQRKVQVVHGLGQFTGAHRLSVRAAAGEQQIRFRHAIIAAGSEPSRIPNLPDDPRIMDSTGALALQDIPQRLLVIGGGIIGLEMATVYLGLGSQVTVVELTEQLMPGADLDLVRPLQKRLQRQGDMLVGVKVEGIEARAEGIEVSFSGDKAPPPQRYDRVLVAVGRRPNGALLGAEQAGVQVNERGFIPVDAQMRTNVAHIFAIGDIVGQPMLAHKATHEGKVAAEVCAGQNVAFDAKVIPSVAYTDPEIAWVGLTETQAKSQGLKEGEDYEVSKFPWAASGRSLGMGRDEGVTKLLVHPKDHRVLGAGIVGPNAGDLIAEVGLAIEMGADAHDIGLTIHPHPTLSETVAFAAEAAVGSLTDLYIPKKK